MHHDLGMVDLRFLRSVLSYDVVTGGEQHHYLAGFAMVKSPSLHESLTTVVSNHLVPHVFKQTAAETPVSLVSRPAPWAAVDATHTHQHWLHHWSPTRPSLSAQAPCDDRVALPIGTMPACMATSSHVTDLQQWVRRCHGYRDSWPSGKPPLHLQPRDEAVLVADRGAQHLRVYTPG